MSQNDRNVQLFALHNLPKQGPEENALEWFEGYRRAGKAYGLENDFLELLAYTCANSKLKGFIYSNEHEWKNKDNVLDLMEKAIRKRFGPVQTRLDRQIAFYSYKQKADETIEDLIEKFDDWFKEFKIEDEDARIALILQSLLPKLAKKFGRKDFTGYESFGIAISEGKLIPPDYFFLPCDKM